MGLNHAKLKTSELLVSFAIAIIYYFSNPRPFYVFDHTLKIASCLLSGTLGLTETNPPNISEFIFLDNRYYSVFPLGSVLSMIPVAILKSLGITDNLPSKTLSSLIAFFSSLFMLLISKDYNLSPFKRLLLPSAILFGTWTWTNQTFAGSWQLALAFSMMGQLACIYYSAFNRKPLVAGFFFSLTFGNRTECILLAPIFLYLVNNRPNKLPYLLTKNTLLFCILPLLLGTSTLWYNYARFNSLFDFGYSRIPGVLEEPWYRHGIFSLYYIKDQLFDMLLKPWNRIQAFPFYAPNPFGSSIIISSPFILLILRLNSKDKTLKHLSYLSISLLSLPLLIHGNSGGWQFAYRYAMTLIPWIYLALLETDNSKTSKVEILLYTLSFILNVYAVYCFHWSLERGYTLNL